MWRVGHGLWLLFLVLLASLPACRSAPATIELNVFAAASLAGPFRALAARFESAHPGVQVALNLAGSQQLAQQIAQHAPADVFASADRRQFDVAINAGRVRPGSEQIFAQNQLVVVLPPDNPAGLRQLRDLARPGVKLVLAAAEVPSGAYTRDFLALAGRDPALGAPFQEGVLGNVVSYEQDVKAVLNKVALGEADAGIVYVSDAVAAANRVSRIDIPSALNPRAAYLIAPIQDSPRLDLARAFVDSVLAPEGQALLAGSGFLPAAD